MMKRLIHKVLVGMLILALSGCGGSPANKQNESTRVNLDLNNVDKYLSVETNVSYEEPCHSFSTLLGYKKAIVNVKVTPKTANWDYNEVAVCLNLRISEIYFYDSNHMEIIKTASGKSIFSKNYKREITIPIRVTTDIAGNGMQKIELTTSEMAQKLDIAGAYCFERKEGSSDWFITEFTNLSVEGYVSK